MADWKTDLKKAYRSSAKWAVRDSNKTYDKTISDTGRDALSRGLGRSSFTTQTLANLETDKNEAGNRIKSEFEKAFLDAANQRELEEKKLALEQQKLDFQMAMSGGGGGGYGGSNGSRNNNNNNNNNNNSNYDPTGMFARNLGYNIGTWFLNGANNVANGTLTPVASTPYGNRDRNNFAFSGDIKR